MITEITIANDNDFKSFNYKAKLLENTEAKDCVLSAAGVDKFNGTDDDDNIVFTIKDTKLYIPAVTLSARDNQKLSKVLCKRLERSVYWNEYKTKSKNKNMINE